MEKNDLMGHEIWICDDNEEARKVWAEFPQDRHRIWTVEETWRHCLDTPEQLQEVLDKKLDKPGSY